MHPLLKEYFHRFQTEETVKYSSFFTQLSLENYPAELPFLFNIENFCLRLYRAMLDGESICIYSDYDTDAVTATATMYHGLISLGFLAENLQFYAPDRFIEGYGMNPEAIQELSKHYDLIVSVDCGINSVQEAKIVLDSNKTGKSKKNSKKKSNFEEKLEQDWQENSPIFSQLDGKAINKRKTDSCDLIITDHHHLHTEIPDCVAVINPRLSEYYLQNGKIQNLPKINTNYLENSSLSQEKLEKWIDKIRFTKKDINSRPVLSSSVTGVGVAWFSLVWLAYFLEEMEG